MEVKYNAYKKLDLSLQIKEKLQGLCFSLIILYTFLISACFAPIQSPNKSQTFSPNSQDIALIDAPANKEAHASPSPTHSSAKEPNPPAPSPAGFNTPVSQKPLSTLPLPSSRPALLPPIARGSSSSVPLGQNSSNSSSGGSSRVYELTDVLLSSSGQSVVGSNAPAPIQTELIGEELKLTLQGSFPSERLSDEDTRFTFEAGILHQTFQGQEPNVRVVLDGAILLEPIEMSSSRIQVRLNTLGVSELWLSGLHQLELVIDSRRYQKSILIQAPDAGLSATPQILGVETIEEGQIRLLKLTGRHFMLNPSLNHAQLNGQNLETLHTEILANGKAQIFFRFPEALGFNPNENHLIIYTTPLGSVVEGF